MTKKEFAKIVADKFSIAQYEALDTVDAVFETLNEVLDKYDEDVYICGFGTFKHKIRKEKQVRHPGTGEMTFVPERKVVVFERSKSKVS